MITFAHPLWILAGAVISLLLWFLWGYFEAKRNLQLQRFVAAPLLKQLTPNISSGRRLFKKILLLTAVFCCFAALARPQYGYQWIDIKHKGIDILFALDTSKSMLVEDIRPNRLERSKLAIMDFVSQLGGDRVGLMPFAGSSYLICPLTADYSAFEQSLGAVDSSIIPTGGTDIGQAIEAAEKILSNEANHKILVLITDGENLQGDAVAAAVKAQRQNMTIYAVGVGTGEGELVPDSASGGFIKDKGGSYVKSRLDEKGLRAISAATGGIYVPLGSQGQGLETIYQQKLALIPKTELAERRKKVPIDRLEWIIAAAVLLLSSEFLLSGRKTEQRRSLFSRLTGRKSKTGASSLGIIAFCFLLGVIAVKPLTASEGETEYAAGNFLKASEYYRQRLEKNPDNPLLLFNSGTLVSEDLALQEKAYYNLGNVHYRQGEEVLNGDPQAAVKQWEQSLKSYKDALSLNPENQDARHNHDLVKSRLEQLRQQQQESSGQQENDEKSEEQQGEQEGGDANQQQGEQENGDKDQQQPGQQDQEGLNPDNSGTPEPADSGSQEQPEQEQPAPKPEEKGQDENNQTASGEAAAQQEGAQPSAAGNEDAEQQAASAQADTTAQAMSREEAEHLLQAMQSEEGRLHLYIPSQKTTENATGKDW